MDAATRQQVQRDSWRLKAERAQRAEAAAPPVDHSWRGEAACAGQDPEAWVFDNEDNRVARRKVAAAKLVCAACPAAHFCLVYAMGQPSTALVGVWGGTTARERQRMRRGR